MNNRKWLIPLALGIIAGVVHFMYVRSLESQTTGGKPVQVLAVTRSVEVGQKISKENLGSRFVPAAYVDSRVIRADQVEEISGLQVSVTLSSGQMIQWTDFAERAPSSVQDLAEGIEAGQRAVTIPVDTSLAMGGMLRPGHRVDILCTFAKSDGLVSKERATRTLLQNVKVLATGNQVSLSDEGKKGPKYNSVTLSVGLEDAELLALAGTQEKLSVALRGQQDQIIVQGVPEKDMGHILKAKQRSRIHQR